MDLRLFGELESEIMNVLWASDRPLSVKEVQEKLAAGSRKLAYTTVLTVLVRLFDKDLLERDRAGKAHVYRPTMSRADLATNLLDSVLATAEDRQAVLAQIIERTQELGKTDLDRLAEHIERIRKGL